MAVVAGVLQIGLMVFIVLLFGRIVVNFIGYFARDWKPRGITLLLVEGTLSATDPPVRLVRRIIPPINLGGVRLDLSVMILTVLALLVFDLVTIVP